VISLIAAGKLFHTRGPATAKLLSPRVVRVRGTASVLYRKMSGDDDDHAQRRVECRQRGTSVLFIGVPDMQSATPLVSVLAANGRP